MRAGHMAIGLGASVGIVAASAAQDTRVSYQGQSGREKVAAGEEQTHQGPESDTIISATVPTGKVTVAPESLEGEPIFVRRLTVGEGITVVEVSTTPFIPVLRSNERPIARPDQPASW